jgi:hypothetical protein
MSANCIILSVTFKVMELQAEIEDDLNNTKHDYRRTSSLMGHTTFQSTRDRICERAGPWLTDWLWWSAELATVVTPLDFRM